MKNSTRFLFVIISLFLTILPQQALAQPSSVIQVGQSIFSLTTFKADGTILASTHGFFIGNNGEAISSWTPFVGAASAVIVDADGKKMDVDVMIGANELYDICKFRVKGKSHPVTFAKNPSKSGNKVWVVGYSVKKPKCKEFPISKVEQFMEKYNYYIFEGKAMENTEGCPFANSNGEVIGIMQMSKSGTEMHATDAAFANTFIINALTINERVLQQTGIRVALPEKEEDALLTLMMAANKNDSLAYERYIDDFIEAFPTSVEGYYSHAKNLLDKNDFDGADNYMQMAIDKATKKDEAHSDFATVIYLKELYKAKVPYEKWNLQKALDEVEKAYTVNPISAYQHQKAQIIYAMGDYQKAYDIFMQLTQSDLRNGELFYEAAQCKSQLKGEKSEIMELLDSAISVSLSTGRNNAAPYYLARGRQFDEMGEYKKAVADYNQYDTLMFGRANDEFYYIKYKCETKIRQYQQALNDIAHAIVINRREPLYYAEMASLQLRVNKLEDAIATCDMCLKVDSNYADPYIIKGIALGELKRKEEAKEAFLKAKELGDERADGLLEKYK